jgi:hypothetical protein
MKLFITAAIGSKDFYLAAERLKNQVEQLHIFDKLVIVTEQDLADIAPWLFEWYSHEELGTMRGYGFYAWKAAIAKAATSGYWGNAQVVCYLDAGCEVLPGRGSKRKFNEWISKAEKIGVVGFSTFTPEWKYSKTALIQHFPSSENNLNSHQFQSGTWFISGTLGVDIAEKWNVICSQDRNMTSDETGDEARGFVEHRHDQSVFSLILKSYHISPEMSQTPHPNNNVIAKFAGVKSPIWAARNRTGKTIIPLYIRFLARLHP